MTTTDLNPTERLVMLELRYRPNQTTLELFATTGSKDLKYFRRNLRTLRMAGLITATEHDYSDTTFSLPGQQ